MKIDELFENDQAQEETKMYFGFSSWDDPYGRGAPEWFIIGPYSTMAKAKAAVKQKLERGQPNNYRDWASGNPKVVQGVEKLRKLLDKEKLNMPKTIENGDLYPDEEVLLWRPSKKN